MRLGAYMEVGKGQKHDLIRAGFDYIPQTFTDGNRELGSRGEFARD